MVGEIKKVGTPIIVAGDRTHPSDLVRKVNTPLEGGSSRPKKEFSMGLKRRLGRSAELTNQHECDAYTAALSAYNRYSNKFHQIDHLEGKAETKSRR